MELNTIKDAFDRVSKKQKLSCSRTQEVIGKVCEEIEYALEKVQMIHDPNSGVDHKSILVELKDKLKEIAPLSQLEGPQKELNISLSKYPKLLEKSFNSDISKAYRNVEFDTHTVNLIIANHFYRQGLFDIGDCFATEAMETESAAATKSAFFEMYHILEAMKRWNLDPILKWVAANCERLKNNGSDLYFRLHSLKFVQILESGNRDEALSYARMYLSPFASNHLQEIQKLMACLLWTGRLDRSPYSEVLSGTNLDKLAEDVIRQFCHLLGQSYESPLSVVIAAGIQGLPPLLKCLNVMTVTGKKQEWQSMKQLPLPVDLDKEFQFHSIFVCPVSKDQASEENPPMLLSCGHVLCKQSITKMSKNNTKTFKCPYCPTNIDATKCRQLHF